MSRFSPALAIRQTVARHAHRVGYIQRQIDVEVELIEELYRIFGGSETYRST